MTFTQIIEYVKRGLFTLLGLFLALYLFVILLTYSANDPSWSHISSDMTTVNNMGGAMGAWLADLLYVFFGWGAWWLFAILIYESVLLWWQSKPIFGLLRLVAYIFLLLAGSALFAQIMTLLPSSPDATVEAVKVGGMGGGIVGTELATRLSFLMTAFGSLFFLIVFVLITATFAFNIHWLALYSGVRDRAWLGSGVKNDKSSATRGLYEADLVEPDYAEDHTEGLYGFEEFEQEGEPLTDEQHEFGQLPLRARPPIIDELSASSKEASVTSGQLKEDSQSSLSNVLNEFLVKSGLGASLQQQLQAEQSAQAQDSAEERTGTTSDNTAATTSMAAHTAPSVGANKDKVEPSFEWNNDNAVSSLLEPEVSGPTATPAVSASQSVAQSNQQATALKATSAQVTTISPSHLDPIIEESKGSDSISANDVASEKVVSSHQTDSLVATKVASTATDHSANDSALQANSTSPHTASIDGDISVDKLADSWLAGTESEVLTADWEADKPKLAIAATNSQETANSVDNLSEDLLDSRTAATEQSQSVSPAIKGATVATDSNHGANMATSTVSEPHKAAAISPSLESELDLTPTNTPPANPKEPPKAEDVAVNPQAPVNSQALGNTAAARATGKPNIGFAVPDGDASNHIEDMVPDTDEHTAAPTLPAIEDDAAYASRSRAMQTAKYRESLTPIPELSILDKPDPDRKPSYTEAELEQLSELLEIKLQDFNVKAEVKNAIPGPVVTRFEVELAPGVKASKVTGISRDLARSLSMASLRVVEVIPGKPYIGIEVPNKKREMVRLIELLTTEKYQDPKAQISMAMGKDIGGNPIITDLARAPHMLVAGTTGSGKSVLVNSMLLSMLLKYKPNELRLILIDPKQLELANYNDIPHLLTPVVTDMNEAASSLSWCVAEMERRYQLMSLLKVRKLGEFNKKVIAAEKAGRPIIDPLWRPNDSVSMDKAPKLKTLPMIVIVADEFADMIMQVGKQAEELITRLAQKSRAAGIHLMLATQRPSVDVITGLIKANIPVRAALRVNSKVDSRTILDAGGAEDMLGNGDMLFLGPGQIEPDRVHGAYVSDEEVNRVCDAWRERGAPDYIDNMASNFELTSPSSSSGNTSGEDDNLYDEAVAFVMETRKVSASSIQRKFSIGYNRAARIVDSMEEAGLVSAMGKSGKRELLM